MNKSITISFQTDYSRSEIFGSIVQILPARSNYWMSEDTLTVKNICGFSLLCKDVTLMRIIKTEEGFDLQVNAKVRARMMYWLLLIIALNVFILVPVLIIIYLNQKSKRVKQIEDLISQLQPHEVTSEDLSSGSNLASEKTSEAKEEIAKLKSRAVLDAVEIEVDDKDDEDDDDFDDKDEDEDDNDFDDEDEDEDDDDDDDFDDEDESEDDDDDDMYAESIESSKPKESSGLLNMLMKAANAVYMYAMEEGADIKRKKARSGGITEAEIYAGKSVIRWEREWRNLGRLTDLSLWDVPDQLGVFQLSLGAKVVFIGNGPLQRVLLAIKENRYGGASSKLRALLTQNAKRLSVRIIAIGDEDDDEARRTTHFLRDYFIGRLTPDWNKLFLID